MDDCGISTMLQSVVNPNLRAVSSVVGSTSRIGCVVEAKAHLITMRTALLKPDNVDGMKIEHVFKDLGTPSQCKANTSLREVMANRIRRQRVDVGRGNF